MKKIIPVVCVVLGASVATSAMAFNWPWAKDKKAEAMNPVPAKKDQHDSKQVKQLSTQVKLYSAPESDAKVLKEVPVTSRLVPIFREGAWIKVGDRQDGFVGWINVKQYHQAKRAYYQNYFNEKTETVYIHSEQDGKKGQKIVAYRNGKKLTEEQAKALYGKMQQQQKQQWRAMQRFNRQMNRMMENDFAGMNRAFNGMFNAPVMMMPGIVVIEHQPAQHAVKKVSDEKVKTQTAPKK